jgi:hypothetical protein
MPKSNKTYSWPASRIDRDIMHELHLASKQTGLPISRLVGDAVHAAMNVRLEQTQPPQRIGFVQPESTPRPAA